MSEENEQRSVPLSWGRNASTSHSPVGDVELSRAERWCPICHTRLAADMHCAKCGAKMHAYLDKDPKATEAFEAACRGVGVANMEVT